MDALISSALEEICKPVHHDGIALSSLCSNLDIGIDLRRSLWINLLKIPSLKFKIRNVDCSPNDSSVQDFDDAEKLGLKILAGERLRENYLGLYDHHLADSKVSDNQHRILERIATARTSGITNIKLAEELQKDKKNIFYEVKKLEARGLIVKQQAVERNRGRRDKELNNNLGVNTNILHLYRYAKHLRSQEKFVVTKDETSSKTRRFEDEGFVDGEDGCGEDNKEDVLIHDFVPEMKAICDKLEETEDKVLAVSNIKRDLGYRGKRFKHRTVNSIFNRLINAGIIEKFDDTMNGKSICCLRLLKKVSLEDFGEKSFEANTMKFGRCKTTDQFVELPLQHHIYDMVEAAGSEGLLFEQVEKRLGIDKKKNCRARDKLTRLFGLHRETDVVVKAHAHRVWTPGNLNSECLTVGSSQSENLLLGQDSSLKEMRVSCFSIEENMNVSSLESTAMSLIELPRSKSSEKDLSQTMTIDAIRREQKIIKRLKDEKVVLKSDLYNWLLDTEKDKSTSMDRRTLYRILNKLETEGKCKMIELVVPSIRNSDGSNKTKLVLHPVVQSSSPELLARIGEMERLAAKKNKCHSLPMGKSIDSVLVDGVQMTQNQVVSQPDTLAAMCANGFITGKMIRAKLLHNFLWGYVSSSSDFDDHSLHGDQEHNLKGSATTFYLFDMKAAIDVIPIASFLQIAGSAKKINDIVEKCMSGLRLSDLPLQEYNNLKDNQAMRRLSSTISILQRLKLIRLVNSGPSNDGAEVRQITLQYALELCPYIEEPLPPAGTSLDFGSPDGSPRIRHDFFLSNNEAIEKYWEILENNYAAADPRIALLAFPGSTVNEVFRHSSWALVRVTTPDQRAAILKRIAKNSLSKKNPDEECKKIAQDLNLTLEQVLDVFYNEHGHHNRSHDNLNANGMERQRIPGLASRKRKRNKQLRSIKRRKIDCVRKNRVEQSISDGCGTINDSTRDELFSIAEPDIYLQTCSETDRQKTLEKPAVNEDRHNSFVLRSTLSKRKPTRRRRFSWADGSDRDLLIRYVRHLVFSGKNSCRTVWTSLSDLPAPSRSCQRRMALLMHNRQFKESLWELCDILRKRYEKERNNTHNTTEINDGSWLLRQCFSVRTEYKAESGLHEEWSDDFNDSEIKFVFEDVLRFMKAAIVEVSGRARPVSELKIPTNTGTIAAKFSSWLHEGKEDLTRGGVTLDADLDCGYIFHLFGLVSTGVLSVSPNLPVEGVGEAEDTGSSKNTYHITDLDYGRRVKGFPGINLCAQQIPVPREDAEQLSADGEKYANGNIPHKSCLDKIQGETTMDVDFTHRTTIINKSSMQGTTGLAGMKEMDKICGFSLADVTAKQSAHERLSEVLGIIMQNPGILEDDIVSKIKLMDPQNCKKLIKKMVQDNILVMRKMYQNVPSRAPTLLGSLVKSGFEKPEEIYREHFFANPVSSSLL